MWQFIAGTGSLYDLVRTSAFDERLDPEKATRAAAHHLRDLYERYGDWYLAMAAYNCGAGNVDKAVERTGYADYWELLRRNALPRETSNYVPIIIAMTIMGKNPKDYGLESIDEEAPVEYESIQMDAPTNLELIADASQQPASVIRDLNPSLLRNLAPAGLQVHVPKGAAETTLAALRSVPAANRDAWRLHHVQLGDTLASVASQYHSAPQRITAANSAADSLEAGELLLVPVSFHDESHAPRGITKRATAPQSALRLVLLIPTLPPPPPKLVPTPFTARPFCTPPVFTAKQVSFREKQAARIRFLACSLGKGACASACLVKSFCFAHCPMRY